MNIQQLLTLSVQQGASDLHLSAGLPPLLRVNGELHHLVDAPAMDSATAKALLYSVMKETQQQQLEQQLEFDFSYEIPGVARFRVNVFHQSRGLSGVFRVIPETSKSLDDLNMPKVLYDIANLRRGLVLVTGPTGSGKSTTLAAILMHINNTRHDHIVTIEDPIEFVHKSNQCLINQREVHRDTHGFSQALRAVLREDPDIIFVGEMRDIETIRLALTAAETGHVVFATLHTNSAAKTINRIVDVFPGDEKSMARTLIAESLQAVIAQTLLPNINGGRVAAIEILCCTPAIRNLIREDKIAQIYSAIQTGRSLGMQTLDFSLQELVDGKKISKADARVLATDKNLFA